MILLITFSFLAGIITVLSPCILPILPIVLTSSIGGVNTGKSRPAGVVIGFILSFTFFTLFLSTIVRLSGIPAETLRFVSVLVVAGFGISLLIPQFQVLVERLFSKLAGFMPSTQGRTGFGGGLLIGFSVGLLWTPCVGPILASVISLAITGTVTFDAFLITLAYSLGTAIPMFLIILGGQSALRRVPWLLSNLGHIQKVFGVLMILTAIGIFFNIDRKFQTFILQAFPQYGTGLTKFEDNSLVQKNISELNGQKTIAEPGLANLTTLPNYGKAPDFISGGEWFNSNPLTISSLKGKVVLVDFWTYTCINCQRTLPYLKGWYEKYKDDGLVIVGVHTPEFEFEKNAENVEEAIKDFELKYPIVQDNNYATWNAYSNRYWPAKYLVDKDGFIRYFHFGEGDYDLTEKAIQDLLGDTAADQTIDNSGYEIESKTPELYLGYSRIQYLSSPEEIQKDKSALYSSPQTQDESTFSYQGAWIIGEEYAMPEKGSKLILNFDAKNVFLVMRPKEKDVFGNISLKLNGKPVPNTVQGEDVIKGTVQVTKDKLYKLIRLEKAEKSLLEIEFLDNNIQVFAFTFG